MPSAMACCMDCSQSTGLTSWFPSSSMMSSGEVWGPIACAVVFMYTVHLGDRILSFAACSWDIRWSLAPAIMGVWKAPEVLRTFAWRAPASSAFTFSSSTASFEPATENPFGKRWFAIWQTPPFLEAITSLMRSLTTDSSKPATESIPCCGPPSFVASKSMASPRDFTRLSPVSKSKTPATVSAVYSPSDRPATALQSDTLLGSSISSCLTAANPAMYMAGWQNFVCSSFSSGPFRMMSMMS
mmetsp:Transcript_69440/g.157568  ORF Transcript_69440/g.157568 Transcript_69440/m.157568 type:complete len:242 (-) Transcript_69440:66-791(-)